MSFRRWFTLTSLIVITCSTLLLAEARPVKKRISPLYPEIARRLHIQGTVTVEVTIGPDGSVLDAKPVRGNSLLSGAAVDAVKRWVFFASSEKTIQTVEFDFGQ